MKKFPIQSSYRKNVKPHPTSIPWFIADLAYSVYSASYGREQSLERLAERGGFGPEEMDEFVPNWRELCSENVRLSKALEIARKYVGKGLDDLDKKDADAEIESALKG